MIRARKIATLIFFIMFAAHLSQAEDLSSYREFQLGTSLSTISKQLGVADSVAKVIHQRPALMQELNWRPSFALRATPQADSLTAIQFAFYKGELSKMVVEYDTYKTKGLTDEDMIEAVSAKYGPATQLPAGDTISSSHGYDDNKVAIARWEDPQNSITLFRSSFQPTFGVIALSKRLDALAQSAATEANRLDEQEAPQREVERLKKQEEEKRTAQENARLANKPTFRP